MTVTRRAGLTGEAGQLTLNCPFKAFWNWFAGESERLRAVEDRPQPDPEALAELGDRLSSVHPELCFELGRTEDGLDEVILSAGGIRSLFPAVSALVQAAPRLPGWRVVAFRPRRAVGFQVCLGETTLGAEGVWYRLEPAGDHADLELHIEGLGADNLDQFGSAAFLMLDAALGEYDVATRIGAIDFEALPEDPEAAGLKPLSELRAEFDGHFASSML